MGKGAGVRSVAGASDPRTGGKILSPGSAFGEVGRDNFGQGPTSCRDPTIAGAMKNMGFMRRFGIGIETAPRALAENGNPPPEFDVQDAFVLVTVRRRP